MRLTRFFRPATDAGEPLERVASVAERLAVLLAAGVPPTTAWGYLGEATPGSDADGVVAAAAAAALAGDSISSAVARESGSLNDLAADAWRVLAAAWFVATESGAPLAHTLRELASSFRSIGSIRRDLAVALAAPQSTARLVMILPAVGAALGALLGFDTVRILLLTVPGLCCLALGVALMGCASRWNRRMIRSAQPTDAAPGLRLELMAIAMSGGGSEERARVVVERAITRYGVAHAELATVTRVLDLARRAGIPAAELLRSEGATLRRRARSEGQQAAAVLAVRLMVPLGVCVLPAFMLIGVAPVLMAVVSSTFESL
jgi:tight adherence protein B